MPNNVRRNVIDAACYSADRFCLGIFGNMAPTLKDSMQALTTSQSTPIGWWSGAMDGLEENPILIRQAIDRIGEGLVLVKRGACVALAAGGEVRLGGTQDSESDLPVVAYCPALPVQNLGSREFCQDHHLKFAYMTGAMANGIASAQLVVTAARAGLLGSYGAAGQTIPVIAESLDTIESSLGGQPFAVNLIHSPNEPAHEAAVVDLLIKRKVRLIEASAYLRLTLDAVRYRVHGIHQNNAGDVIAPNQIIAKVSRVEVALKWLSPPPEAMLAQLLEQGHLTTAQSVLARQIPMAQDLIAEADSGGHTDNRPAIALLPTMLALAARITREQNYPKPLRVGAAGGIATPASATAAYAMGASFIVTGTVNQACVESGSCDAVRKMLGDAQQADVIMAPAADMFEMGVKLQVLKRGTMFAMRAAKLYDLYRAYNSIDEIPAAERASIEKTIFRMPLTQVWAETSKYFGQYDPGQIQKAASDPHHQMALIFRWYLGLSSIWANGGESTRQLDYQVWCGPAMGAFNEWTQGSFLEAPENRKVVTVAFNLMYGAAVAGRLHSLSNQGVGLGADASAVLPYGLDQINLNARLSVKEWS